MLPFFSIHFNATEKPFVKRKMFYVNGKLRYDVFGKINTIIHFAEYVSDVILSLKFVPKCIGCSAYKRIDERFQTFFWIHWGLKMWRKEFLALWQQSKIENLVLCSCERASCFASCKFKGCCRKIEFQKLSIFDSHEKFMSFYLSEQNQFWIFNPWKFIKAFSNKGLKSNHKYCQACSFCWLSELLLGRAPETHPRRLEFEINVYLWLNCLVHTQFSSL